MDKPVPLLPINYKCSILIIIAKEVYPLDTIHIQHAKGSANVSASSGTLVADIVHEASLPLAMPCNGTQKCGKCLVWVQGDFSAPDDKEIALLKKVAPSGVPSGFTPRLACCCRTAGAGTVILPQPADAAVLNAGNVTLPAYDGEESPALGIAVDVGTTTIALCLYDLPTGTLLATATGLNQQASFGADVLSRIAYSDEHGTEPVSAALLTQLQELAASALQQAQADSTLLTRIVITGNTTMLHYVAGLNPSDIGKAPFTPQSLFGTAMPASALFPSFTNATLYLPRCIGAYVGGDITCGMVATNFTSGNSHLLVDVGTNGEMALFHDGKLLCCSTAAGPAFEGVDISMGMTASPGAISAVSVQDEEIQLTVIGNAPAKGICGTGLISAIYLMLQQGILDDTGEILTSGHPFAHLVVQQEDGQPAFMLGNSGVSLSQKDVRNVQLAKSAISAGILTLLHEGDLTANQVQAFYLCGGFGSYINSVEAAGIGLFPAPLLPHTTAAGNSSIAGAIQMLFSNACRAHGEQMGQDAVEISLSSSAYFMEQYVENMMFDTSLT